MKRHRQVPSKLLPPRAENTAQVSNAGLPQADSDLKLVNDCLKQGRFKEALTYCQQAIKKGRRSPKATPFVTMGRVLLELARYDDAEASLKNALALDGSNPDAYFNLGLVFEARQKPLDAFNAYQATLHFRPADVLAYNNLAGLLIGMEQFELAIAAGRMAVSLAPDQPDVYLNLAMALRSRGLDGEALETYRTIVALKPDHGEGLVELSHRRQHFCDWDGLAEQQAASLLNSYRLGRLVSPFSIMALTESPMEQLLCARLWGSRSKQQVVAHRPKGPRERRLKIGYLSADFHAHATAMLLADLIELHDKTRFEIFAYSMGPDDGSTLRRRIAAAADRFVDVRGLSNTEAARLIRADEIDILLDLKGYTQNARIEILARQPAPVQVNFLGFPATMGAPFIHYIIADAYVAPMSHQEYFDEKIIHLPHCYQPNDRQRSFPETKADRNAFGLPENGFVFCCFNSAYKITPEIFDVWMRLLDQTAGSVLWLLETNPAATVNLRLQAERRGIAADRLVFAPFTEVQRHLERLTAADLFLDTYPVNAHTTASEALWVGLPVLTLSGETFVSRVAGSLLHAVGLPGLVTETLAAYETIALHLTRDRAVLASLQDTLKANRTTTPLFDTPRYARGFEAALIEMAARFDAALPCEAFAVPDST